MNAFLGCLTEAVTLKMRSTATSFTAAQEAVNPECLGTKACAHYSLTVNGGDAQIIRLRMTNVGPDGLPGAAAPNNGHPFGSSFDDMVRMRLRESDEFYASLTPPSVGEEEARIMRQGLAGMLWNKQYYLLRRPRVGESAPF